MSEEFKKQVLSELGQIKTAYQKFIRDNFEFAAQNCQTCPTIGACCTDAHFVNVHITRLEAVAIKNALEKKLSQSEKQELFGRIAQSIEKYNLKVQGDTFAQTFACPLFKAKVGCLIHDGGAKPVACIQHACYEKSADLPPQCLQDHAANRIEKLNCEAYDSDWQWLPLPLQLIKIIAADDKISARATEL